jgi:RND superfamily putative drug exporter
LVVALVLCCSFVFLVAAFGSVVLPVKAIVMNLPSRPGVRTP